MKHTKTSFLNAWRGLGVLIPAIVLTMPLAAQPAARPADMLGLAQVGHHVSDLDRSIKFFEALDFKVVEGPSKWAVDQELNKLGNTPGAETRTAVMQVQSSVSDVPFKLILRQYRGVPRQDWSKGNSWDLLASHIDLTYDGNVSALLDKLEGMNMLKMPEVDGLQNPRQQPGFRPYAFIQDPDGLTIEYFSRQVPKPSDPPPAPKVSNSTATAQNIDRLGKQAGFNHYATNVINAEKAQDFYVKVLGGDYPPIEEMTRPQLMMHGWFPQATTDRNLRVELIFFKINEGKTAPPVKFQDINANYAVFQTTDIDAAYTRAKANGAITVTNGGVMKYGNARAVMIRDSDVGGYIMLWQPGK